MADTYRRYCRDLLLRHEIFLNWEEKMEGVIAVVYTLWAIYSGYKVMSRRERGRQSNTDSSSGICGGRFLSALPHS